MTPLVLVHGFMGGSAQWTPQRAGLQDSFEIITPDLPGFGDNADLPPLNRIPDFADWVISDLRARGIGRYHLLGHSMGGMIVQEMVRCDPDNIASLTLYGTGAVGVLPGRFETIEESKARAQLEGAVATARRIAATWFLDRDASCAYPMCADIAQRTGPQALAAGLDAMQAWRGTTFLPQIAARTLVMWGDKDRTYPWAQTERLWTTIEQASLAVVPGCAHAVHLEKPDIFNQLLLDFLNNVSG